MATRILTVEDRFQIANRGLVVVPGPRLEQYSGPLEFPVVLRRPDGTERDASLEIQQVFQSPPAKERRWGCVLKGVDKDSVPVGTEVWSKSL